MKIIVANRPAIVNQQLYTGILLFVYFFVVTARLRRETSTFHVLNNKTIFSLSYFRLSLEYNILCVV